MSVITLDMIKLFAKKMEQSLEDGSQYPGIVGTLELCEAGEGEIQGKFGELFTDEDSQEVFAPLKEAYLTAIQKKTE